MFASSPRRNWLAILLLNAALLGCQRQEQIQTYSVERSSPPRPPLDAAAVLKQLDHTLVAIVPSGKQAWFFKLVGKAPAIDRQRESFEAFLKSIQPVNAADGEPRWQIPEGWKEGPAAEMRAATLLVPDEGGELELAISSLPMNEDWESFLVPNVNRWLRQLQRAPLEKQTILKLAREVPLTEGSATVFELSGVMASQSMGSNPHAGLGIPAPEQGQPSEGKQEEDRAQPNELTYEKPDGWQQGKMSSFRKAAFLLPDGGAADEVTVTSFPAGPGSQMADVGANVQRWAGQVGMTPPTTAQLGELVQPITVDGSEGAYVELLKPEGTAALFVAMIERGGQVWFFKMSGQRELVVSQREGFLKFLESVRFPQ